ncbi:hypothetical protein CU098_009284 [Rhizopus stolonifer]|uniref:Uncharacterized protein n=1 Tax=Rhizopus stolonifer TaxID=4846 RepID=A0A367KUA6_RHIST|nr:hypothetical protein CU098_009284 [Rhizopus stolonifer]
MWSSSFTRALKLTYPIVQAPCAGHTGAELVAAVSNAGGLGSLGAGMIPPSQLRTTIQAIQAKTSKPFAVNLFCRPTQPVTEAELQEHCPHIDDVLNQIRLELGIPIPTEYKLRSPPLDEQVAVLLETKVPVVSFTFGMLPNPLRDKLWDAGTYLIGTATTVQEALMLAGLDPADSTRKADAIVAQGLEAGGHRGSFLHGTGENHQPMLRSDLIKAIRHYDLPIPLLAAGGISHGEDVYRVLQDADGAVIGTLFMLATESATPPPHREYMLHAEKDGVESTKITTAITGKQVRSYPNKLMKRIEQVVAETGAQVPVYDIHSSKTKDIATFATMHGLKDYMLLLSGANTSEAVNFSEQGTLSALDILQKLVTEVEQKDAIKKY